MNGLTGDAKRCTKVPLHWQIFFGGKVIVAIWLLTPLPLTGQRALAWLSSTVALQFITVCTALASVAMVAVSFARRQTTWSLAAMDSEGQVCRLPVFHFSPSFVVMRHK